MAATLQTRLRQLLASLARPEAAAMLWLLDLLADVGASEHVNTMSCASLAIVIAPNLVHRSAAAGGGGNSPAALMAEAVRAQRAALVVEGLIFWRLQQRAAGLPLAQLLPAELSALLMAWGVGAAAVERMRQEQVGGAELLHFDDEDLEVFGLGAAQRQAIRARKAQAAAGRRRRSGSGRARSMERQISLMSDLAADSPSPAAAPPPPPRHPPVAVANRSPRMSIGAAVMAAAHMP